MKKQLLIASIACLALGTSLSSCKKKKTSTDFLTDPAGWMVTKYEESINGGPFTPLTLLSCDLDNRFYFLEGGTTRIEEGATKCNPSDPQTRTGTWSFIENNSKIIIDGDTATINTLDENTLNVSTIYEFAGDNYHDRVSFSH